MTRLALLLALLPLAATAQSATAPSVRDCDTSEANARNLMFPLADHVRAFANGAIQIIDLDTGGEPVCCAAHLMVLLPATEGPGNICALISDVDGQGWAGTRIAAATAAYDAVRGLTVTVPVAEYGEVHPTPRSVDITVNQATGAVTAVYGPV